MLLQREDVMVKRSFLQRCGKIYFKNCQLKEGNYKDDEKSGAMELLETQDRQSQENRFVIFIKGATI